MEIRDWRLIVMKKLFGWVWVWVLVGCGGQPVAMTETAVSPTPFFSPMPSPSATATLLPAASPTPSSTPLATATPMPSATPNYPLYAGLPLDFAQMGVQIHFHHENLPMIFNHLQTLGVGWVKVQVSWKLYQPAPDRYDPDHFAELDEVVSLAATHQMAVLVSVSKAPEWSRPTTELDGPPRDYTLYQQFMAYLAARYQGRVAAYELWNEPNLQREWNGVPLVAADFVRLVQAGAAGVKTADSQATVISGALAPTGINDGETAVDDRVYLQQALAAGLGESIDAIGIHPYGWANPPDSHVLSPDVAIPSHNNHPSFFFYNTLWDYKTLLEQAGITRPLWVTEFGWGSFEGLGAPPPEEAVFMKDVSEWQQATYTLRAFELGQQWEWVGPMMLWNLNFGPLLGTDFPETGYSLLHPDGYPRPVYLALQAAANQE